MIGNQSYRAESQRAMKEQGVENWGQGPWFELDRDDATNGADGAPAADVAAQERPAQGMASTTPPDAVEPRGGDIAAADGASGPDTGPANIFDLDADAGFPNADIAETVGGSGVRSPRPSRPSAPYFPSTAPSRAISPSSRITHKPVLTPPPDYTFEDYLHRSSAQAQSAPTRLPDQEEKDTTPSRIWRPTRRALIVTLLVLLIALGAGFVAVSSLFHLPAPPLGALATQAAGGQPASSATAGVPIANTAAVVAFTAANQRLAYSNDLNSCPSGCDVVGQTYGASQTFSKQAPASQIPQTALSGTIHVVNNGPGDWSVSNYSFSGGGYSCNPRNIYLVQGASSNYSCFISASSPSSIPAGTIAGTASSSPNVTFTQPAAMQGNGSYQVTSADCQAALNDTKNSQGVAWAASWQSSQSIPGGWQWAKSAPSTAFSNDSCPSGQQQASPFNFTASSTTTASNNAYNPSAAQSLAKSRLNGQLPSGYAWKSGDPSSCAVTVKGSAGSKVTLACAAAGTAVYAWTDALKADLIAKLLSKNKDDALAACNSAPGIQPNTCVITLRDNATSLPDMAKDVTIQVNQP
jgi:hypothetical protein